MNRLSRAIDARQRVLRQTKQLAWFATLGGIVLLLPPPSESGDGNQMLLDLRLAALGVILLSAYAAYRRLAQHIRSEARRVAMAAEAARLEGVALATNTVQHQVSTKLAVAVGYSEILADDPRLPPDLGEQANKVFTSAMAAANAVDQAAQQLVRVQIDTSIAGPPLLDLDRSAHARQTERRMAPGT